ncbi:MAG: TRAP transporter large permease subunit [Acidobacteriia bacterium]|nr:TRAP transporter large permease subunit [Methyloceanibacter sp.]MCL6491572.1 TRAP transporter large permease subunit [Terriglobia bacterium]
MANLPSLPSHSATSNAPLPARDWGMIADAALGLALEIPAAILMVVEIVVLFAGVVSRYVFHTPLVWSDELAETLFLWLAMLGAGVAFRRREHMRMTAAVNALAERPQMFFSTVATVTSLACLVFFLEPAYAFVADELVITTPALQISAAWRAAALPVGFAIMAGIALLQLWRVGSFRQVVGAIALVGGLVGAMVLLQPLLANLGYINLLIFFVGCVAVMVFAGVPIAFSFALAAFGYLVLTTETPAEIIISRMDEGMSALILLAVPMFVFLGLLIEMTGMARAMVEFLASLFGHVRGGLHYVLIGAMYLVSGISGAKAADMAAVAPILFPEMRARGAEPGDLLALLAATGAQTETIPPSLVLITIGSVTGVSIAALFNGGLLPGALLGLTLCLHVWWRFRKVDMSHVKRASIRDIGRTFIIAVPGLLLPFLIRASVMEGLATATEVSTIGVVYSLVVGLLIYRRFDWGRIIPMLVETASLSGAILLIIGAATAMAWALTQSGFSAMLAHAMAGLPGGRLTFFAVSIVAFIILGSVLEGIPAMVLFGPLMFPIARQIGIDEVHYAMVTILAMGIGLFSPPFGVGYYTACAISRIHPDEGMRHIAAYMAVLLIGTIIVALLP